MQIIKLLVVVDNSLASSRAANYVAQTLGGRRDFRVCQAHTLPMPPGGMVEFDVADVPKKENRLEARLRISRHLCVAAAMRILLVSLELAYADLRRAGYTHGEIEVQFCHTTDTKNVPKAILKSARERGCHTVVVGAQPPSWLREHQQTHPAGELARLG